MSDKKFHSIVHLLTLIILGLFGLNILGFCTVTVSCYSFIPTLSYVSTFRTHDILTVLIGCVQSIVLLLTFISCYTIKQTKDTLDDKLYRMTLEVGVILMTLATTFVDESNGLDFLEIEKYHKFFTFSLCYFSVLWSFSALWEMKTMQKDDVQTLHFRIAIGMLCVEILVVCICIVQWTFAGSIYMNWFLNQYFEGIFEWVAIIIAVRFPYHICRVCNCDIRLVIVG